MTLVRGGKMSLDSVDGDLTIADGVVEASKGVVRVAGNTYCLGDCKILGGLEALSVDSRRGALHVDGDLTSQYGVSCRGNLSVKGALKADHLEVRQQASIGGDVTSPEIMVVGVLQLGSLKARRAEIGGTLRSHGDVDVDRLEAGGSVEIAGSTTASRIDVGGRFHCKGDVRASDVDVGGSFEAEGEVDINKLDVGGVITVGGGKINGKVDVGGSFTSRGPLRYERLEAGAAMNLAGGFGGDIEVGGRLVSDGSLTFNKLMVGGIAEIQGDASGREIRVGGAVSVANDLKLTDRLRVGGAVEAGGVIEAESINVNGLVKAARVEARKEIEVNRLTTSLGAKGDVVEVERRGVVKGAIIGRDVIIREGAEVEEVWGDVVTLLRGSKAKAVYARLVRAEAGSNVLDKLLFTYELHAERGCRFQAQPARADKLPDPPS